MFHRTGEHWTRLFLYAIAHRDWNHFYGISIEIFQVLAQIATLYPLFCRKYLQHSLDRTVARRYALIQSCCKVTIIMIYLFTLKCREIRDANPDVAVRGHSSSYWHLALISVQQNGPGWHERHCLPVLDVHGWPAHAHRCA